MKTKNIILVCLVVVIVIFAGILIGDHGTANAPVVVSVARTSTATGGATGSSTTTGISAVSGVTASSSTSTVGISIVMSTSTSKNYSNGSFAFTYPGTWSIFQLSPFSINNFNSKYDSAGIIPPGGAEIDVVTTTAYASVQTIMDTQLMSAIDLATSTVAIDGLPCTKASYQDTYTPQVASQNVSLYCSQGTGSELWEIYFSYRANDPAAQAHVSDFSSILKSMKFLPND